MLTQENLHHACRALLGFDMKPLLILSFSSHKVTTSHLHFSGQMRDLVNVLSLETWCRLPCIERSLPGLPGLERHCGPHRPVPFIVAHCIGQV